MYSYFCLLVSFGESLPSINQVWENQNIILLMVSRQVQKHWVWPEYIKLGHLVQIPANQTHILLVYVATRFVDVFANILGPNLSGSILLVPGNSHIFSFVKICFLWTHSFDNLSEADLMHILSITNLKTDFNLNWSQGSIEDKFKIIHEG